MGAMTSSRHGRVMRSEPTAARADPGYPDGSRRV